MIPLNETLKGTSLNLTLNFQNFSPYWFQFQEAFAKQHKIQEEWGLQSVDLNELKRMYVETNIYLLGTTMVVSLLHTIFEALAFKHDIQFWNSRESMEGISVKSLYFQLIQSIVI
jgi:hypothetical protein